VWCNEKAKFVYSIFYAALSVVTVGCVFGPAPVSIKSQQIMEQQEGKISLLKVF